MKKMGNSRKGNNSDELLLAQIIVMFGFVTSILVILKNWNKSPQPSSSPSSYGPHVPSISFDTSQTTTLDERNKETVATSKENHLTLTMFIEDNQKLISVLGVFTAITIFVGQLRLRPFGYALSFMFMTLTVILWLELWGRFPSGLGDWRIFWFENVLSLTVIGLVVYWLLDFRDIWHDYLFLLIFLVLMGLFSTMMKKFDIFNRLFHTQSGKRKGLRYFLGIIVLFLVFLASMEIAMLIAPTTNSLLDALNNSINSSLP